MRQWPRKAIWAKIMTSGIIAFTKRSNALIPKVRAAILPIVAPPRGRQVDGHYEVKVNGAWVSVLPGKILKQSAPDLGFHVCAPFKFDGRPDHLYCVVVPPQT